MSGKRSPMRAAVFTASEGGPYFTEDGGMTWTIDPSAFRRWFRAAGEPVAAKEEETPRG